MTSIEEINFINACKDEVLGGRNLSPDELYALADIESAEGIEALTEAAGEITHRFCPPRFDSCSIINARSGRCSENCKWCAQSAHFKTSCNEYECVDHQTALDAAHHNADSGVGRLSLVASGKALRGKNLDAVCAIFDDLRHHPTMSTCASLGLLSEDELKQLWNSGVHRYHCNLETAPSHFGTLCTTHTQDDKIRTIMAAKRRGFEVCSGGIIGMGESRRQRVELAIKLREVAPASIPINILSPIPGTPLEGTPLISEEEIVITVALFRFAHPKLTLRFAGGRARMSRPMQLKALRTGINGAIIGDLLTTIGSTVAQDKELAAEAGYTF